MTLVQGELRLVTDTPDEVSQVWIQAPKERLHGTGMVTTGRASEQVTNGVVSFNALPGAAVMVLLVNGIPSSTVKLLIPDKADATLRECIEAVGLADAGELDALEELALEVSRIAAQIASADRLETWASETASAAAQAQTSKDGANDAANRAGMHESSARQAELNAQQHESSAKQYDMNAQSAAARAASEADNVRGELQGFADSASDSATSAADSATEAKTAETNANAHADSAASSAQRAEFAADETIQQVEGDFATRNYVDDARYGQSDSLPAGIDLDTLFRATDSKVYRLVSGRAYSNLPDGLSLTTNATLIVSSTGLSGMQMISQNSSGRIYWRPMHDITASPRTWLAWRRLDTSEFESTLSLTFQRRAQLEEGINLNTLRGNTENGIRILGSHGNYPNRPESGWTPGIAGAIVVFSTGLGDTWQRVWQRHAGHVWERQESANGGFTDWQRVQYGGSGGSAPITALALPQTTFEAVGMLTTYEEGEAYLDLLNMRQPIVEVRQFGQSNQGRPIRGIVIGDDTKPALFIMCAQHGDEVSGREAAFIWARQISEMRPNFLEEICVVIVPTVNADKINIRRLTATGTDLNGGWQSRVTNEVQAVYAGIESFDTRAVIDAHEGGSWTQVQLCEGTAPEIDAQVLADGQAFYDAVWAELEAKNKLVARWEGSDKLTNSRNAIPYQLGIPCLLVEMPGQLARAGWNGPGPDPRVYQPDLSERVSSYQVVFEGAAKYLADTVAE